MGDPATEDTATTNSEHEQAITIADETGVESTSLRAAALAAPILLPVPVPTTRSLRMFLGVLKHNPSGVIREVGVLLMLHASSTEVAIAAGTIAAEAPSALLSNKACNSSVGGRRRRPHPQSKQRRESAHLERRAQEAAALLALALSTEQRRVGYPATGVVTAARSTKRNKTRFQHQLRQPAKVEDRLQAWAATRGREVSALRQLLAQPAGAELGASSAGARLVRDRAGRIPVGQVRKVRWSFALDLEDTYFGLWE